MTISASIVLYKTDEEELSNVISCLLVPQTKIKKLYLIDNSPTDYLRKYKKLDPRIEYIFNDKNIGYGAAHNIALKEAIKDTNTYHIVLNADTYFTDEVIPTLIDFLERNKDIGQVMPKITYPNGDLQYLCKLVPTPLDLILRRFIPESFYLKRRKIFQLEFTGYSKIMEVPYLSGCFMLLRVESLINVGIFDERFFMYPEDIDLTRRIAERYKTIFYPEVTVVHNHAKESFKSNKMLQIHIINMIKYFNKWGWIFDKKRRKINRETLQKLNYK